LKTFEKQAPIWTLGVGGRPLEVAFGGDVARLEEEVRSRRRGGADGDDCPFSLDSWARLSERLLCLVVVGEEERLTWPSPVPRQLSSTGSGPEDLRLWCAGRGGLGMAPPGSVSRRVD